MDIKDFEHPRTGTQMKFMAIGEEILNTFDPHWSDHYGRPKMLRRNVEDSVSDDVDTRTGDAAPAQRAFGQQ
eukprot:7053709-Prorocentrum_lima.AAC.1